VSPPAERADQLLFTFFHLYGTPAPGRKRGVGRLVEEVAQLTGETKTEAVCRALVETGIVLHARLGAEAPGVLERALDELEIQEIPFGEVHWREAADAYRRFGKGRHEAHLSSATA